MMTILTNIMERLVVHCKHDKYDVYIGRNSAGAPKGTSTEWGNPFQMKNNSDSERNRVIEEYREWLTAKPDLIAKAQRELKGKVLACWCAPKPCHGDVLAEFANASVEVKVKDNSKLKLSELIRQLFIVKNSKDMFKSSKKNKIRNLRKKIDMLSCVELNLS